MEQFADLWKQEFQKKGIPSSFKETASESVVGFEQYLQQNSFRKGTVLDLGAGNGRNSIYLSKKGFKVSAADFVPENIQAIQETDPSIDVRFADLSQKFPFADGTFDYAIDVFCYKHIVDEKAQENYLNELKRVLKKGGLYMLSLASVDDGYYGPLLASSSNPERRVIVDPHTQIPSILYRKSDIEKKFPGLSLLEFGEKKTMGVMHGKLYSRCILTFIFEAFLVL